MTIDVTEREEFDILEDQTSKLDEGILTGVKLLGIRSKNKRKYTSKKAVASATALLEGAQVHVDHPAVPSQPRGYRESFGVVESVTYAKGKGHFGTLKFCPTTDVGKKFIWDVRNNPKAMGMSINAMITGEKRDKDGDLVVEEIRMLRSVDLVTRPGTADGIFEHEEPDLQEDDEMPITLETLESEHKDLVDALLKKHQSKSAEADEIALLKKQTKEAQEALDAIKAEKDAKDLRDAVEAEYTKIFEGREVPAETFKEIVECACQMQEADRKAMTSVIGKLGPMLVEIPDDDGDDPDPADADEQEGEKPEVHKPAYRPGARKAVKDLRESIFG